MSEPVGREWRFYVDDMVSFAQKVLTYTAGLDQQRFVASELHYGEAATHVSEAVRLAHPEVPWRLLIATRNRLIHGYLGIDDDTLWSIVTSDVPKLLPALQALKAQA